MQVAPVPAGKSASDGMLRGLKKQGQRLGAGFEYLMMFRPRWIEAKLRRHREVPWELKRRGQYRTVTGGCRVRGLLVALKWMQSQACARGRLMWNLISSLFDGHHGSWG